MYVAAVCAEIALKAYQINYSYPLNFNWNHQFVFSEGGASGFAVYDDQTVIIGFSGTYPTEDWVLDLNVNGFKQGQLEISEGPWLYTLKCVKGLCDTIALRQSNVLRDREIIYCGHSLGGCAATLAPLAAEVLLADPQMALLWGNIFQPTDFLPTRIFTYGSPRCLSLRSAAIFPWNCLNIWHDKDPVPLWPPSIFAKRASVGRTVWVNDKGDLSVRTPVPALITAPISNLCTLLRLKAIKHHHSQHQYIKALSRFLTFHDWRDAILSGV